MSGGDNPKLDTVIAHRFRIDSLLGRGGTGWAYRVRDETNGGWFALKLLDVPEDPKRAQHLIDQFEREFHSLVELAHPRVVHASDYGLWNDRPFYILELLDGGDLHELAPLGWQDVCSIAYDVCSALSLLHSRRLIHRDITPRNIRRTADGKAKLIDFGLLMPMGVAGSIAGTPPFVSPELIDRSALDARSDLFSLGCTLYYALTGRACYPARTFGHLAELWKTTPLPPSTFEDGIPQAVDDLVMALLRIDPAARPKSAAEVMERLLPLLAADPDEELSAARSYLSTPQLVGRKSVLTAFRERLLGAHFGNGAGFIVAGEPGVGRSRMLNSFVIEAKLIGGTTLRASAIDAAAGSFGVAAALAGDLLSAQPSLARELLRDDPATYEVLFAATGEERIELRLEPGRAHADHFAVQTALRGWILKAARDRTVAIAVDDADQIDALSGALLAALGWDAPQHRIVYAVSVAADAELTGDSPLAVLAQHAERLELPPLTFEETRELLASVFGEVPHLSLLTQRLFDVCGGRPRDCMWLAQHLVDTEIIRYAGGSWTLPAELPSELLPEHMEEALEQRVRELSPLAQRLGLLLSLTVLERLSRAHCLHLDDVRSAEIDRAISQLRSAQMIVGTSAGYALCHASFAVLFTARASDEQIARAHLDLARVFPSAAESVFAVVHHLIHGGCADAAIAATDALTRDAQLRLPEIDRGELALGSEPMTNALLLLLSTAEAQGRPPWELQIWRAMIAGMAARGAAAVYYYRLAEVWLAQLKRDSGYDDWQALADVAAPGERIQRALAAAAARHAAAAPERRGAAVKDALNQLTGYVLMSIAVGVRVLDLELQRSLPPLLEPFAPLSPMIEAMLWNARATQLNGEGKREQARETFVLVLQKMDALAGAAQLAYLDKVRAAIQQTIGEIDASLGVRTDFIERLGELSRDPNQRVGAHYVKMVLALNAGDRDAAERHRRDAELLSLQNKARSMFSTLGQELEAHVTARDLTGLKQVRASITAMARHNPGWLPVQAVAEAHYQRACGDLAAALQAAAALRDADARQRQSPWCLQAIAIEAELLVELGRAEEALAVCEPAWSRCEREGMRYYARLLGSALALAEAALGRREQAIARAERVVAELESLGVSGLQLGRAYETAERIALMLGIAQPRIVTLQPSSQPKPRISLITSIMSESEDRAERAQRAIDFLCEITRSNEGHLFLRTDAGLELVASRGPTEAPAVLTDIAKETYESQHWIDTAAPTLLRPEGLTDLDGATEDWEDGRNYARVVLRTEEAGVPTFVGVAMLGNLNDAQVAESAWIATVLAGHLKRFCDVPGARSSRI